MCNLYSVSMLVISTIYYNSGWGLLLIAAPFENIITNVPTYEMASLATAKYTEVYAARYFA